MDRRRIRKQINAYVNELDTCGGPKANYIMILRPYHEMVMAINSTQEVKHNVVLPSNSSL